MYDQRICCFSEADPGLQKQKKLPKAIFFVFGVRGQRSAFTVYNSKKKHPDEICQEHHIGLPVKKFLTSDKIRPLEKSVPSILGFLGDHFSLEISSIIGSIVKKFLPPDKIRPLEKICQISAF